VGRVKVSHSKVPPTFIDEACEAFSSKKKNKILPEVNIYKFVPEFMYSSFSTSYLTDNSSSYSVLYFHSI